MSARPSRDRVASRGPAVAALTLALAASATGLLASGCATPGNSRAGNAEDVASALARWQPAPDAPVNRTRRPLAFLALGGALGGAVGGGTMTGTARLAAFDLSTSKLLWNQPAELTARVEVGTDVIIHAQKGAGLVARDVMTGAILWQHGVGSGERLVGYAIDGVTAYLVVQSGSGSAHRRDAAVVALDARSGGQRWRTELASGDVGGPAARGGLVAIPMQSQYVVLLDGATGAHLAQILSSEEAAVFVRALPEGLFFGSKGIFLVDRQTAAGSRKSPGYLQANLPKFVRPFYHHDMYRVEQMDYSAIDRNRILWRVTPGADRASFKDGLAVVHNYRFFFGLDPRSGDLRWAYNQPSTEAVSSSDTGRAIVFVTADGQLGALDRATGRRLYTAAVSGVSVRGATFDADGFVPSGGGADEKSGDLASVLSSIIWDPDRRFWDVKIFAIEQMAKQPGREVTADLLKISQKEGIPPAVYLKAGEALIERKDGSATDLYNATLKVHNDYAEDQRAQAVEMLARAAMALGGAQARSLAPALIEHLRLPDTEPVAAAQISRALAGMGATEALPALRDFLSMYRAEPTYDADPGALIAAAEAIVKLGGAGERQLLLFIAEEPKTVEPLRLYIRRALTQTASGSTGAASSAMMKE